MIYELVYLANKVIRLKAAGSNNLITLVVRQMPEETNLIALFIAHNFIP